MISTCDTRASPKLVGKLTLYQNEPISITGTRDQQLSIIQVYQFDINSAEPIVLEIGEEKCLPEKDTFINFDGDTAEQILEKDLYASEKEPITDDCTWDDSNSFDGENLDEPDMALNVKNKVTPLSTSTNRNRASSTPKTGSAIFNIARVKKVELNEMPTLTNKKNGNIGDSGNNVLRKVASLTAGATTGDTRSKNSKPVVVPEKLSFAAYEKFEGN